MKQHSFVFYFGIICAFVLGFGLIAGVWAGLSSETALGYVPSALRADKTGPNSATLDLSTWPDSLACHKGTPDPQDTWVTYCPSTNFELPANSTITVNIANFDGQTALHNEYFDQVQGTVGGTETVDGQTVNQVDASTVSHTFTIQSKPGATYPLFISVPVVGVADDAATDPNTGYPLAPELITFQFKTGPAGTTYVFKCYDPCGNGLLGDQQGFAGPMATIGYMAGFVTVTNY